MHEDPGSREPLGRRRIGRLRRFLVVAIAALAGMGTGVVTAGPAGAVDSTCTRRTLSGNKVFHAYVTRPNVGWVSWQDYMNINAYDRCNHGGLSVGVSFYEAAVRADGGSIRIGSVRFQTSGSTTWRYLNRVSGSYLGTSTGYSVRYSDGGHLDLTPTTRITKVQVNTHLNYGGSVYAPRAYTCDLVQRTCS